MNLATLSDRQLHLLRYIAGYLEQYSWSPTFRDIKEHEGMKSLAQVAHHVRQLQEKGYITHQPHRSRTIRLASKAETIFGAEHTFSMRGIPIMGRIAAGSPLIIGDVEEVLDGINAAHLPPTTFALRVQGDSMIDEHILDGDIVLIAPCESPRNGDVIVATHTSEGIAGATTLKYWYREPERIRLQPANDAYPPLIIPAEIWDREWLVQGKVIGVVRWHDLR